MRIGHGYDVHRLVPDRKLILGGVDIPYEKGVSFCSTIDGFIVSDNVVATAQNVDSGFAYSDHNPVLMTFRLN